MNFNVTVQGTPYKTIVAASVMAALQQVVADRDAGLISGYDRTKPDEIVITRA